MRARRPCYDAPAEPRPRDARRDRIEKMAEYAVFGIRFYWLVDLEARTLEVYELGGDGTYRHVLGATEGSIDAPGCDGLVVDLDGLWRLDALEADR